MKILKLNFKEWTCDIRKWISETFRLKALYTPTSNYWMWTPYFRNWVRFLYKFDLTLDKTLSTNKTWSKISSVWHDRLSWDYPAPNSPSSRGVPSPPQPPGYSFWTNTPPPSRSAERHDLPSQQILGLLRCWGLGRVENGVDGWGVGAVGRKEVPAAPLPAITSVGLMPSWNPVCSNLIPSHRPPQ